LKGIDFHHNVFLYDYFSDKLVATTLYLATFQSDDAPKIAPELELETARPVLAVDKSASARVHRVHTHRLTLGGLNQNASTNRECVVRGLSSREEEEDSTGMHAEMMEAARRESEGKKASDGA
jgi:hypothetical protein